MPSWKFTRESQEEASGTVAGAGMKSGNQPFSSAHHLASKRNIIATDAGWVRRQIKQTDGNAPRILDEILVAAHPGDGFSYAANTHLGNPDIAQIYIANSSPAVGDTVTVGVVFNEPVKHSGAAGALKLIVANTAAGQTLQANAVASNSNTGIINANNTLVFTFNTGTAGSYKIQAQTIANNTTAAANVVTLNAGSLSANLVVTGAVSNTVGTIVVSA